MRRSRRGRDRNLLKAWLLLDRTGSADGLRRLASSAATASPALRRLDRAARRRALLVRRPDRRWAWSVHESCFPARRRRCTPRSSASRPGRGVMRPQLYVLSDGYPRALLGAGRGAHGGAALAVSVGLLGVASPAELEGIVAHELAHLRHRDVLVQTIGGDDRGGRGRRLAHRRLPSARAALRARPDRRLIRAPPALPEARVRGRPVRGRALRLAARARGRAPPPRAGTTELVSFQASPVTEPLYIDEPVRGRGAGGALRLASRHSASACAGCARSTPNGARSCAQPSTKTGARHDLAPGPSKENGRRPTLPGDCSPSTIGASGLNFSVRNGKRCFPAAMTAQLVRLSASALTLKTP